MSLLQDFEIAKRMLGKKEWALIEKYLEEYQDKDLGKVLYWQGEWEKFQEWKIKTFLNNLKNSNDGTIISIEFEGFLQLWGEKIDKENYCVELLIVNGDSGMYEDVILNVDMYNEKTINNSIKEIIAILNLSNKEIVERYLNE